MYGPRCRRDSLPLDPRFSTRTGALRHGTRVRHRVLADMVHAPDASAERLKNLQLTTSITFGESSSVKPGGKKITGDIPSGRLVAPSVNRQLKIAKSSSLQLLSNAFRTMWIYTERVSDDNSDGWQ